MEALASGEHLRATTLLNHAAGSRTAHKKLFPFHLAQVKNAIAAWLNFVYLWLVPTNPYPVYLQFTNEKVCIAKNEV